MSKQQMKRINLNEEYALSADPLNILLLIQTKDKEGNFTGNYRPLGYYSSVEACIKKIQSEVLLSTIYEVNSLESLVSVLESYMSKLHDNVLDVVKELRSNESKELRK